MLRIGTKLGLGIGTLLALCVVIGLFSYMQTRDVGEKVEQITQLKEPINSAVYGLENNLVETAFGVLGYLSTGDRTFIGSFERNADRFEQTRLKYSGIPADDGADSSWQRLEDEFGRFRSTAEEQITLRDLQARNMETLLNSLDQMDDLLTRRVQAAISVNDLLAYRRMQSVLEMEVNANAITKGLGKFLLTRRPQFEADVYDAEQEFKYFFQVYEAVLLSSDEKRWAGELRLLSDQSIQLAKMVILLDKRRTQGLSDFVASYRGLGSLLNDRLQSRTERSLMEAKQDVLQAGTTANRRILAVLLIIVVFGVGAGVVTTRNITRPIHQLASAMTAIARGDRLQRVDLKSNDELGTLGAAFNQMTSQLSRANEELRITEQRFRLSIEAIREYAIFMLDPRGCVASWNEGAERIKGIRAEEIIGKHFSVFYPEEDIRSGKPEDELRQALETGRVETEGWRVRKDGSRFWAHAVVTAVRDESGTLRGYAKVTRDITEKKKMEEELRESELRFRTIVENAPIGIATADAEGRFMQTNAVLQAMLGDNAAGLSGRRVDELIHPDDAPEATSLFTRMDDEHQNQAHAEVKFLRRDGRTSWINVNVSRMQSGSDRSPHSIIMMEDITARRRTEQQMRMLAHTITSMNESVVITDSQNSIVSVNPAFRSIYGYAESEVLGKHTGMLGARTTNGSSVDGVLSTPIPAGGWTGEVMHTRKNGEEFPALLSTSVVRDDTGAPIALVSIARDITEQVRLQRQLEEVERQRVAALRRFAVSVQRAQEEERERISRELHDDLCQRLSGMKFTAEAVEDDVRPLNLKAFRRLRDLKQELDKTITEVQRISSNLRPSVLNDFGLLIAMKRLCKEFERVHGISMSVQLDESIPRHVDPNVEIALYRIAQEALSNVAKHAGATSVALHLLREANSLSLLVEDNGKGFDQADTARAKGSGHGLGLISMAERSELLGGKCTVRSSLKNGTAILVSLPLGAYAFYEENQNSHR
jgi:PAS domain S-box-containing protein